MSALQQQLMQPPAPRYPTTTHSILSAHLTAPPRNNSNTTAQSPMLVVSNNHQSAASQLVSVSLAADQVNGAPAGGQQATVQLVNQQPVQIVSNTGQVQLVNQPQLQVVNHHVNNAVQLVNNSSTPAVQLVNNSNSQAVQLVNQQGNLQQVQLVNQAVGGAVVGGAPSGQQIMVNNVPMQLSLSPHVQFSVSLPDNSSNNSIATLANGVNQPIIVSGAPQPGNLLSR